MPKLNRGAAGKHPSRPYINRGRLFEVVDSRDSSDAEANSWTSLTAAFFVLIIIAMSTLGNVYMFCSRFKDHCPDLIHVWMEGYNEVGIMDGRNKKSTSDLTTTPNPTNFWRSLGLNLGIYEHLDPIKEETTSLPNHLKRRHMLLQQLPAEKKIPSSHQVRTVAATEKNAGGSRKLQCNEYSGPGCIPSPSPTLPTLSSCPIEEQLNCLCLIFGFGCNLAGAFGDPHVRTFDGIEYDCQAAGDFILMKTSGSPGGGMEVQGRFKKVGNSVSIQTGVAVTGGLGTTKIELVIPNQIEDVVDLFVNGFYTKRSEGYQDDHVTVYSITSSETVIHYNVSNLVVYAAVKGGDKPSPRLDLAIIVPNSMALQSGTNLCGLWGTPDGSFENDWTTSECVPVEIVGDKSALIGQTGYDYCTNTWCIRNQVDSLFTYNTSNYVESGCDVPFPGVVDLSAASPELIDLCGTDEFCLVDGLVLGTDEARESLFFTAQSLPVSLLVVTPSAIQAFVTVELTLTIDLTSEAQSLPGELSKFAVYRVNPLTREVDDATTDRLFLYLEKPNNGGYIFSNKRLVVSITPGESFGFKAIPVINNEEQPSSSLVVSVLNAVQSFSSDSGIGYHPTTPYPTTPYPTTPYPTTPHPTTARPTTLSPTTLVPTTTSQPSPTTRPSKWQNLTCAEEKEKCQEHADCCDEGSGSAGLLACYGKGPNKKLCLKCAKKNMICKKNKECCQAKKRKRVCLKTKKGTKVKRCVQCKKSRQPCKSNLNRECCSGRCKQQKCV